MLILNTEITTFLAEIGYLDIDQNTKQPLSNFEAIKP